MFLRKIKIYFLKINFILVFLYYFDALILKKIKKLKIKNIILMHFRVKNTLRNNYYLVIFYLFIYLVL